MITVLALFPLAANAEVLSGWTSKVDYETPIQTGILSR